MQSRADNQIGWYRRGSLRAELATGFAAVIALTLVVGLVALFAQNRSSETVNKLFGVVGRIADLSLRSNVAMLKARRAEKDFLIFQKEFGFEEARSRYVTLLRTNLGEVRQSMTDVRELSREPEVIQLTRAIDKAVGEYEAGFLRIVNLYSHRGQVTTGFEGKFREKAHEIEAIVSAANRDRLMVDLLTLRRQEKDFIARGTDKHVGAFAKGIDRFRADLALVRLSPEDKTRLLGLTTDYARWFEEYVQTDAKIDAEQETYLAAAHTVEPLLTRLYSNAEQNAYATRNDAETAAQIAIWAIGAAVLLAALLGLTVALIISRSITNSVDECLGFASRVAQGDLSTRLPPKGESEFGTLAVALNRMTEVLAEREAGLRRAQHMARLSNLITAADGSFESWSDTLPQLAGLSPAEMPRSIGEWLDLLHPEDRETLRQKSIEASATGGRSDVEYRLRRMDAGWIHVKQVIEPMGPRDAEGRGRWFNTLQDITEQKREEARISRLNRVYAVLSGINSLIVRARDRDELFRDACVIAVEAGHFAKAWIGIVDRDSKQFRMVAAQGGDPLFFPKLEGELRSRMLTGNSLVARALATRQPVISNDMARDPEVLLKDYVAPGGARSLAILPLLVSGESVGVFTLNADTPGFFDNEEMKLLVELAGNISFALDHIEKAEKLDYLAYYDVLTGLANRRLFLERVAQYMRSADSGGHKLAVALIDLERFKSINDSLGRPAGDALLRQVAEWLTGITGDASLLARVGADHFAGVLPQVKQGGDVARLLEKTMEAFVEHPFRLNDAVFRVGAKVGVAVFPDDGADAEILFRNAEAALKKAKSSGERYLFHTQKMTEAVAGKLTLENQLRQALDKGEFVLHYQPKVCLASGKLTGAEALIRWNDPRAGLVPPGRFIPVLEETGLIYDVGRWALRKAIEDYLRWRAAGLPAVRVAVNVSPLQLRNSGFIDEISQVIGIDAQAAAGLEIEITESLIMEDVKGSIASLQAIRDLGVTIAIDDFGTGFSSLSYLAKLPVDTLKIDRTFVIEMTVAPEGLALVSTIINLAHSLNLKVVAEGVETEEQSRLLRLLACDEMQGFLFSKPVPVKIFEERFLAPPAG